MKFTLLSAALLLTATSAFADQIVLNNGDRITGTIIKKDGATLTIKSDLFGVIATAWEKVESIESDTPVYVTDKAGVLAEGNLVVTNGIAEVGPRRLPAGEITALRNADEQRAFERLEAPNLTDLWAGTGTAGWAGSLGNAKTLTFTTGLKAARATRNDKTSIHFDSIKATAQTSGTTSSTAQAIRGGVAYDRNFSPSLFVSVFNDYEYDRFQNLDLRFVVGAGGGLHALATTRTRFDLLLGGAYNRSAFATFVRNSAEAYYGDEYQFKFNGSTTIFQTARIFHDVTRPGQYRVNADVGAAVRIAKWLNWNLSVSNRYLNTPSPGRKSNDILYTTGFGVSFSH
jgi:hypothetical protein